MAKDDTDCSFFERPFQNNPGVRYRAGYPSLANDLKMVDFIGPVQEDNPENLIAVIFQSGSEISRYLATVSYDQLFKGRAGLNPPPQLHGSGNSNCFCFPYALNFH